ncbi:hypothetical protein NDA13_006368 [Ustilago tritici]|nr:hypothetical protein NDA13_006368 [Ustilago tritici]
MYSTQGNRKVLPNYLLDDYVPSSNPKPPINNGTRSSSLHVASEALQRHHHPGVGPSNSSADGGGGERGDASSIGLLPRRKKKLRQACIYCRRSHLVCEDKRPCHRCVKRGIADRCVDPPQDGQPLQDGGWFAGQETGSNAGSIKDAFVSPMPPAAGPGTARPGSGASSSTLMGMDMTRLDSGQRCKRKAKTEVPHQHINDVERHGDNRPSGAYEFSNPASLYTSTPTHAHAIPTSTATGQGSLLSSAMPHHSAAPFSAMPVPVPLQAEFSTAARAANSQLLQGQPIFQPPSSAELDSLFSAYFFDVADAFNPRPANMCHQQGMHPPQSIGQPGPLFHPQHAEQQRSIPSTHPQHHPSNQIAAGSLMHASHGHHTDPSAGSCMDQHNPRRYNGAPTHSQQMRPHPAGTSDASNVDLSSIGGTNAVHANVTNTGAIQPAPVNDRRRGNSNPGHQDRDTSKAVAPVTGQNPGDVYAPYPYRKGYASLMRYMTEQSWSEESIRSVEAALSKVRRLWFSLEDNIQPSSMIQLQAEWAGNVRYFSESVVPFTPVPMVVCRKAGEVYASNQLAQDLCGRRREQLSGGKMSCYELMTESSASEFFRLYETAVGGMQAEDGSYVPTVGNTAPLYWNAEIVRQNDDGSKCTVPTRGVFEMKIAPCGLPSLLVVCFVPLS